MKEHGLLYTVYCILYTYSMAMERGPEKMRTLKISKTEKVFKGIKVRIKFFFRSFLGLTNHPTERGIIHICDMHAYLVYHRYYMVFHASGMSSCIYGTIYGSIVH